jgi:hypothetical protein
MTDPAKRIESIISSGTNSSGDLAKFLANRCHTPYKGMDRVLLLNPEGCQQCQ